MIFLRWLQKVAGTRGLCCAQGIKIKQNLCSEPGFLKQAQYNVVTTNLDQFLDK